MNSKIELRIEAVKLAANVEGVTDKNVIAVSEKIAKYILGNAELPEVYDPTESQNKILAMMSQMNSFNKPDKYGENTESRTEETEKA